MFSVCQICIIEHFFTTTYKLQHIRCWMTGALYLLLKEKLHLQSCNAVTSQHIACTQCKQLISSTKSFHSCICDAKGQFMINNNTIRWNASKFEMNVQKTTEVKPQPSCSYFKSELEVKAVPSFFCEPRLEDPLQKEEPLTNIGLHKYTV
jgi:hypothetical protein